ncbi:MAG: hypothetical protein ACU84H_08805 [Gammaproteobacteria bacterium]
MHFELNQLFDTAFKSIGVCIHDIRVHARITAIPNGILQPDQVALLKLAESGSDAASNIPDCTVFHPGYAKGRIGLSFWYF